MNGNQHDCAFTLKNGDRRSYMIHLPANFDPDKGLVFMYHGSGQNQYFYGNTGWFGVSDENGFAFIGGVNDPCETGWASFCAHDEDYSQELIEAAIANLKVNRKRIFLTGFSAGAGFTYVMASRHPDLITAIAAYEGNYIGKPENPYYQPPAGPVSVLILNGSASRGMPFCGTQTGWWTGDQVFAYWAKSKALDCKDITRGSLCDRRPRFGQLGTPSDVTMKKAIDCKQQTEVVFYGLKGGIHRYYDDKVDLTSRPGTNSAPYNAHFNAATGTYLAEIIWKFFDGHGKP